MIVISENLLVDEEPFYEIQVSKPDGTVSYMSINNRTRWKRVTAISKARYAAKRNPTWIFNVMLFRG